jgi:hypothetical protein
VSTIVGDAPRWWSILASFQGNPKRLGVCWATRSEIAAASGPWSTIEFGSAPGSRGVVTIWSPPPPDIRIP